MVESNRNSSVTLPCATVAVGAAKSSRPQATTYHQMGLVVLFSIVTLPLTRKPFMFGMIHFNLDYHKTLLLTPCWCLGYLYLH